MYHRGRLGLFRAGLDIILMNSQLVGVVHVMAMENEDSGETLQDFSHGEDRPFRGSWLVQAIGNPGHARSSLNRNALQLLPRFLETAIVMSPICARFAT